MVAVKINERGPNRGLRRSRSVDAWLCAGAMFLAGIAAAESISIPGVSFETPVTFYVNTNTDFWQKSPKPPTYDESHGFTWDQLIGTFLNPAVGQSDRLDNCDGLQAAYLFAIPELGLFQDFDAVDWNGRTNGFGAQYTPGKAYILTVGLNGSGGGMQTGVTLALSFYYRDASGNRIVFASTTVTHSPTTFPNHTHFVDFQVRTPFVQPGDPWAGKHIGIQLLSTVSDALKGGYWDMDNFRLVAVPDAPVVSAEGANARITWASYPGYLYQLQTSPDFHTWTSYGTAGPGDGNPQSQLYPLGSAPAFFRVFVNAAAPGLAQSFAPKTVRSLPGHHRSSAVEVRRRN